MQTLVEFMNRDRLRKYKPDPSSPDYKFDFEADDRERYDQLKTWLDKLAVKAGIKHVYGYYYEDEGVLNIKTKKYGSFNTTYKASSTPAYTIGKVKVNGINLSWNDFLETLNQGEDPFKYYFLEWLDDRS